MICDNCQKILKNNKTPPCSNLICILYKTIKKQYINLTTLKKHRNLHNKNDLFYTLSPVLLVAIVRAFNILKSETKSGLLKNHAYYEFGLFKGFSLWFAEYISREYADKDFMLYGFDSFEGLPKSKIDIELHWIKGNYAASLDFVEKKFKENGTDFSRIKLFKGFFSPAFFNDIRSDGKLLPISICVIDSDLYESCVSVLDFVKDYLEVGSILLFDDYNAFLSDDAHGERRALSEFEIRYPSFKKECLFDFGKYGMAFRVVKTYKVR